MLKDFLSLLPFLPSSKNPIPPVLVKVPEIEAGRQKKKKNRLSISKMHIAKKAPQELITQVSFVILFAVEMGDLKAKYMNLKSS